MMEEKKTRIASMKETALVMQGYLRRVSRKMRGVAVGAALLVVIIFAYKKIFFVYRAKEELSMEKMCLEFINKNVDRCLQYKSRSEQNKAFAAIKTSLPLVPLKMTKANAVFLYTHKKPHVVIKRCIVPAGSDLAEDEVSMSLNNEYVVKFFRSSRDMYVNQKGEEETIIWLFMEYLGLRISQESVKGSEERIREIATCILQGLKYLHGIGIAHLDLKISNVMGKETRNGMVYKIIDFGFARRFSPVNDFCEMQIPSKSFGTYPYKPPETSQLNMHGVKGDIWCLGAIVWFLSLRQTPFYFDDGKKDVEKYRLFVRGRVPMHFRSNTSLVLKDFVKRCMLFNRFQRPTAAELLEHPFITQKGIDNVADDNETSTEFSSESGYSNSSELD